MRLLALTLTALLVTTATAAPKSTDDFVEIQAGTAVTIRSDRAYLLFRTNSRETRIHKGLNPVFLRIPDAQEMAQYEAARNAAFARAEPALKRKRDQLLAEKAEAVRGRRIFDKAIPPVPSPENFNFVYDAIRNLYSVAVGRAFEKPADGRVLLIEAKPGRYVLYGWGQTDRLITCLCLGTVSFSAEAGRITDLGTLLMAPAAEESSIPELKPVTGFGPAMSGHVIVLAAAVKPVDATMPVPAALAGKPITPAQYRATGKFVSPFAFNIHRLAPIPGILGYDRGTVLDLVSGTPAENHLN